MGQNTYQLREHKHLTTDMHVQMLKPEQGIRQLRSQNIRTDLVQSPMAQKSSTIDEDLMSRLRYTCSRFEDIEISTDAVEQIDDELEITVAALVTRMQFTGGVSGGAHTIIKPHPTPPYGYSGERIDKVHYTPQT